MSRRTVLVVDDEPAICRALHSRLTAAGYDVLEAPDGTTAVELAATGGPDAMVLDLGLPDFDGTEVVRRVRLFSDMPIVILSALDADSGKIAALDLGADDYVTKPFNIDELLARLRALLRRGSTEARPTRLQVGRAVVDLATSLVTVDGNQVRVTPTEWALLAEFVRNPGKLLTHRHLIQTVWGGSYGSEASSLRIYVSHLRRLIEDEPANPVWLLTEPGAGYRCAVSTPLEHAEATPAPAAAHLKDHLSVPSRRLLSLRAAVMILAVACVLAAATWFSIVVYRDRQDCPPGPWAHPLDRLLRRPSGFVCYSEGVGQAVLP